MIVIENKYSIGDTVYLKTDKDQNQRVITGVIARPSGVVYLIGLGERETSHYEIEVSDTIDNLLKVK